MMRLLSILCATIVIMSQPASAKPINYASVEQGATIENYTPAHEKTHMITGTAAIGGKGRYTLFQTGKYPQVLAVNLGQVRTIKNINVQFRIAEYTPDHFKLEYADRDGKWHLLKEENNWSRNGISLYNLVLDVPVKARKIRFTGYKTGFTKGISENQQKALRKGYGDSVVINRISAFAEENAAVFERSISQITAWIDWELAKIKRRGGKLDAADSARLVKLKADWKRVAAAKPSSEKLNKSRTIFKNISDLSRNLFLKKQAGFEKGEIAVGWLDSLERTREDVFEADPENKSIELKSARNEYEDVQVVLFPTADFKNVTIDVSLLTNEQGDVIDAKHIKTFDVKYVETLEPYYETSYVGRHENMLSPAKAFSLKADQVQPILLSIYTPADAKPGKYAGAISIKQGDTCRAKLNLTLDVWGFTLPTKIGLPNVHSLSWPFYKRYYQKEPDAEIKKQYYDFMIEHRLNPTSLYLSFVPQPEFPFLREYASKGMSVFNVGRIHSPGQRESETYFNNLLKQLPIIEQKLKEMKLLDKSFIYLTDEPVPHHYSEIIRRAKLLNKQSSIRMFAALNEPLSKYPAELLDECDIICPLHYQARDDVSAIQKKGKEAWWYIVSWGFAVDDIPMRTRMFPWIAWWYGVDGVMQWTLMTQWRCDSVTPGLPSTEWNARSLGCNNGAGNYIYPGEDGLPLSSLRLKNYRDGLEDYEYFLLLSSALKTRGEQLPDGAGKTIQKLLALENMVDGEQSFNQDLETIKQWRNTMGDMLDLTSQADPSDTP